MEKAKTSHPHIRLIYFLIGIVATIAYRVIVFLNFYDPMWVKVSWYVGTIGFVIYFWHRYDIAQKRAMLVAENDLEKAVRDSDLKGKQKQAIAYLVKTSRTSKSKINFVTIFGLSVAALVFAILLDVIMLVK